MRAPFATGSVLTLRRLTLQADSTLAVAKTLHVSCGYVTQPVSGGDPVYRERWLPDLDVSPTVSGFLQRASQLVSNLDTDFDGVVFRIRAVYVDVDANGQPTISVIYDVVGDSLEVQRRLDVTLPPDSFWSRAFANFVSNVQARMA